MKSIYILGISAFYHDSAAAILKDGKILAAAQEERFTRKKGDKDFPINAIYYCLQVAERQINEIDYVVFYDKPILKFDRILASYIHSAPKGILSFLKSVPLWLRKKLWTEDLIKKELKYKKNIFFTEHHQSHAASAFFPSPYSKAAIVTIDGAGEWTTTTIGLGEGNHIRLIKKIIFPHSLGLLYSAFTYYCGFKVNSGEYKLMGLAPYGTPKYIDIIKQELITIFDDGSFIINEKYFNYIFGLKMINGKFEKLFGRKALKQGEKPDQFYMDIAASIQQVFNEILVLIAREAKKITGERFLCLAGGVALNCVANGHILNEAGFDDIWIQPAAGDAGGALGSALYLHYDYLKNERVVDDKDDLQQGSYLGPKFTDEEIQNSLDRFGAKYRKYDNEDQFVEEVAKYINSNNVVGWFQGRMEFGPRALGSRSILANPQDEKMQSVLNLKIKFRESFRPFAPSVLEDKTKEYFDIKTKSPYMLLTCKVKENHLLTNKNKNNYKGFDLLKIKRSDIPAVTHVDNSARIQTVSKKTNSKYYKLIKEFYKKTGCPVIINTSFNVRGEPIVCTPKDAFLCFMGTNMDILAIGNFILKKSEQPNIQDFKHKDLEQWKKTISID